VNGALGGTTFAKNHFGINENALKSNSRKDSGRSSISCNDPTNLFNLIRQKGLATLSDPGEVEKEAHWNKTGVKEGRSEA